MRESLRHRAEWLVGAEPDVVLLDPLLVARDNLAADEHAQRSGDRFDGNAQVAGPIAIDGDLQFGLAER